MNDVWASLPFPDAIDFREGPGILAKDFRDSGVPLIRLAGIRTRNQVLTKCNFLDPVIVQRKWRHFAVDQGDVLLSTSATLGEVAVVGPEAVGAIPYTGIIRMRPASDAIIPAYIPWLLRSPDFLHQATAAGAGSVMTHFGPSHLRAMKVRLPPRDTQHRIANTLQGLEDLIDTNHGLAADCETLAVNLAWHDPAQRAPLNVLTTTGIVTADPSGLIDHYSLPAFDAGRLPERVDASSVKSRKAVLRGPVALISRLNPHIPRVWMAYPNDDAIALASTEFVPLTGDGCPTEFVWAACAGAPFLDEMRSRVTGTTGSHQRVDKAVIPTLAVPDPRAMPAGTLDAITSLVRQAHASRVEADDLRRVSDELLPLLMSGRIVPGEVPS